MGPRNVFVSCRQVLSRTWKGTKGGGWPDSGEAGRRRRGPTGQGARGGRGEPVGGFGCGMGWPEGGRRRRAERGGGR